MVRANRNYASYQPDYTLAYRQDWRRKNPKQWLLRKAKQHSKERNLEYNISEDDLEIPDNCPILNIPLILNLSKMCDNSPSIDRFDSSKGYVKGNVNVISWRANRLKNDGRLEEFKKLVNWMENFGTNKP